MIVAALLILASATTPIGGDFVLEAHVIKNGGVLTEGGDFQLMGVLGQQDPFVARRGGYELQGGLLAAGFTDILFRDYFEVDG